MRLWSSNYIAVYTEHQWSGKIACCNS